MESSMFSHGKTSGQEKAYVIKKRLKQKTDELSNSAMSMRSRMHQHLSDISRLRDEVELLTAGQFKRDELIKSILAENRVLKGQTETLRIQKHDILRVAERERKREKAAIEHQILEASLNRESLGLSNHTGELTDASEGGDVSNLVNTCNRLRGLYNSVSKICDTRNFEKLCETIDSVAPILLSAETFTFWSFDEKSMWRWNDLVNKKPVGGVVGSVIKTGQPICLANVIESSLYNRDVDGEDTISLLVVPVKHEEKMLGIFSFRNKLDEDGLSRKPGGCFERTDTVIACALAVCCGSRIFREKLSEEANISFNRFKFLAKSSIALLPVRSWQEFGIVVQEIFATGLCAPSCVVYVLEKKKRDKEDMFLSKFIKKTSSENASEFFKVTYPVEKGGLAALVAKTGQRIFSALGGGAHPSYSGLVDVEGTSPLLVLPIKVSQTDSSENSSFVKCVVEVTCHRAVLRGRLPADEDEMVQELVELVTASANALAKDFAWQASFAGRRIAGIYSPLGGSSNNDLNGDDLKKEEEPIVGRNSSPVLSSSMSGSSFFEVKLVENWCQTDTSIPQNSSIVEGYSFLYKLAN